MARPLVVGVDGSEATLWAVDWAADEAARRKVPLRLVHASLWERFEGAAPAGLAEKPAEQVMAENIVEAAAQRAHRRQAGVPTSTDVLPEEPASALVRESRNATAVVLGTHGRGGLAELLLGSVSLSVAERASCPVIVLRGSADDRDLADEPGLVVLGVKEAAADSAAARFALQEAELRGVPLEAVRAWRAHGHARPAPSAPQEGPAPTHEQQAVEALKAAVHDVPKAVEVYRHAVQGAPRPVLLAASQDADLLVVGARRERGHARLRLGRVARGVLHHSACPVAVVPERS
ncbi:MULTISPECIES: universal stress protein [Streptomyces]|uniref:universal stress protein n=1 Tax=Streptomyces TaxID=1883 RepID=UPI003CEED80B